MRKTLFAITLALACFSLAAAQKADRPGKGGGDQQFVTKASAAGLAEVNFGKLAVKQASSGEVKKFAKQMVQDHTKGNEDLLKVADKKGYRPASAMDAEHDRLHRKLSGMRGADFDREYMASQVKDHKEAVSLFEKQSKSGSDEDLRRLAEKMLPTLKEHLMMAQEVHGNLKGGRGEKTSGSKDTDR